MARSSTSRSAVAGVLLTALAGIAACSDQVPVSPHVTQPDFARGGPTTSNPTVTATTPSSSTRNITLSVTVSGSGFDAGSRAVWALHGDSALATTKIRTNSTTFVSSKQLTANITVASDAPLTSFDVLVVTTSGKKGIGIELFAVLVEAIDIGAGDGSSAEAVNDAGQIVGHGGPGKGAYLWQNGVIRDLGALPGMTWAAAEDINNSGQVVGYSSNADGSVYHAFIWTAAGGMQRLGGSLGGCCDLARSINDLGVVGGEARLPGDSITHAVVWENGVIRDVHSLAGGNTFPWDLTNSGLMVGQWNTSDAGFAWSSAGGMQVLAGLDGPGDIPIGANDNGQIVGWYNRLQTGGPLKAFLWENGAIRDLGTLGGLSSVAFAIDNSGKVVGRSDVSTTKQRGSVFHAFVWTAAEGMRDLGSITSRQWAQAMALNVTGLVVGETWLQRGFERATLWRLK
jgi:probable HAF family extracellular repeat protein